MKVMYQGKEIELEEPDLDEKTLDYNTPVSEEEINLDDTLEITEDTINEINSKLGEENE